MILAESDVVYSENVARKAGRFISRHRFRTKFGFLFVAALIANVAMLVFIHYSMGTNWVFGVWATIVGMNIILPVVSYFALPGEFARSVSNLKSPCGHIVVDEEEFRLSRDANVTAISWSRYPYVWVQENFVVLCEPLVGLCLYLPTEGMTADVKAEFGRRGHNAVGA